MRLSSQHILPCLLASTVFTAFLPATAQAADVVYQDVVVEEPMAESRFDIDFSLTGVTDYRFRGVSQTDGDPAVQATIEASYAFLYLGTFLSYVDFGTDDPDIEVDVYGGVRPEFGDFTADLGVIGYIYPSASDLDFYELYAGVSYDAFDVATLSGYLYYDPDNENLYANAAASVPLVYDFTLDGSIGFTDFDESKDYYDWSVGLSYAISDNASIGVAYIDTSLDSGEGICTDTFKCGSTIVGTFTVSTSLSELTDKFSGR